MSKLKRFHGGDLQDIEAMIDLGLVPHDQLLDRFRSAVDLFLLDSRATGIPKCVRNLNRVERDMLGVAETRIELPSWLDSDED